ncbi:unnamed protein product [Darwinula stevensoni]|uniref:Ecdysteroid-phosphate phosphatase n=1 Tax=Darwinula stevensoni TaxID=69355 RepID=A0A7R8XFZ6_9CRUS|nr:unnamed protein product [Darwinula stevensoni]CAG0892093.1 unnamed protein product [Darwinula stevensoni]
MAAITPPRKISTSTRPKVSLEIITATQLLLQMGFPKNRAEKALAATGDRGVHLASDWLLAHAYDPSLDEVTPREYILYLCPTGSFLDQIQIFLKKSLEQCGWNGAHNYLPHIALSSHFSVADCNMKQVIKAFHDVIRRVQSEFPEDLILEPHITSNFMGLFVNEQQAEILKQISMEFIEECKNFSFSGDPESPKSFHLSFAYQFPGNHTATLENLVKKIDHTTPTQWEFHLYSRDAHIRSYEVHKVLFPLVPQEVTELELILGDFVYVKPESINVSPDGWVEGTSWLTGCSGFLPLNRVKRTPQTDAWTLHKSIALPQSHDLLLLEDVGVGRRPFIEVQQRLSIEHGHHIRLFSEQPNVSHPKQEDFRKLATTGNDNVVEKIHKVEKEADPSSVKGSRKLIIVRHGERMENTFDSWILDVFEDSGKYNRKDRNMPCLLPMREGGCGAYYRDGPLTQLGHLQARSLGEMMHKMDILVHHVYCSPSYRCIQTCDSILKGMGLQSLMIKIEPGLFEYLAGYQDGMPTWFTPAQFHDLGFNIDLSYAPLVVASELYDKNETIEQFYIRNAFISEKVVKATETEGGNILFVAHAATLETCTRLLVGHAPRNGFHCVSLQVPYCGVAVAEEYTAESGEGKKWRVVEPPFPPFTNSANYGFDWKLLLHERDYPSDHQTEKRASGCPGPTALMSEGKDRGADDAAAPPSTDPMGTLRRLHAIPIQVIRSRIIEQRDGDSEILRNRVFPGKLGAVGRDRSFPFG